MIGLRDDEDYLEEARLETFFDRFEPYQEPVVAAAPTPCAGCAERDARIEALELQIEEDNCAGIYC